MGGSVMTDDFERAARVLGHQNFERVAGKVLGGAIRQGGNLVRRKVRARARPHRRSGHMSDAVTMRVTGRGMDVQAKVHAGGPVAHLIAGGVRAHDIEPGKSMPIHSRTGTVTAFATAVHHPGFPADPFFHHGVRDALPEVNKIVDAAIDQLAHDLVKLMER
jgi:hypothetical protein